MLLPLVDPASVLGEGVQLIVSDEVGFEVLLPVAHTLGLSDLMKRNERRLLLRQILVELFI